MINITSSGIPTHILSFTMTMADFQIDLLQFVRTLITFAVFILIIKVHSTSRALLVHNSHKQIAYDAFASPIKHVPGPFYSRFTRLPLKLAIMSGRRSFFVDDLHKQYGPVVRIAPTEISIASVDGFKEIHRVGGGYLKSDWYGQLANFPKLGS